MMIMTLLLNMILLRLMLMAHITAWAPSFLHRPSQHSVFSMEKPILFAQNHEPQEDSPNLDTRNQLKKELCDLLKVIPSNRPTGLEQTRTILSLVRQLEDTCPTPDDLVLIKLVGNWELVWTAVDPNSLEQRRFSLQNWINPIENQSYGNNPNGVRPVFGRSNPILPRSIQDQLEEWGVLHSSEDTTSTVRSSQSIDLKKGKVRNVVSFRSQNPWAIRGSIIVDIDCAPSIINKRRVDVKFTACRILVQNSPLDIQIPLGPLGPSGWLETRYMDDTMRITRGHKGSVFILSRV